MSGSVAIDRPLRGPDQEELAEQERLLVELTELLATREADLATNRAELDRFRIAYLRRFAPLYAELDRLELETTRLVVRLDPGDREARRDAHQATRQAEASEAAAQAVEGGSAPDADADDEPSRGRPTDLGLKELYRQAAKAVHPDMAASDEEQARRTVLMSAINEAYVRGDADAIQRILDGDARRLRLDLHHGLPDGAARHVAGCCDDGEEGLTEEADVPIGEERIVTEGRRHVVLAGNVGSSEHRHDAGHGAHG